VAPWPALALWRAYESPTLTTQFSPFEGASHEGGRLAVTIGLLAVVSAVVTAGFTVLEARVTVGRGVRRAYGTALAVVVVSGVFAVVAAYGGPSDSARRALDSIKQASPTTNGDPTNRLFSLSSNGRLGTWGSALDDYRAHAVLGSGAGTFERWWLADRSVGLKVRDAHSLYLETLAELGPFGLAALLAVILAPLVAAVRARRSPYVAPALAGFVALLVHAALDWDWEVPAVMIAGLTCAGVLLLADGEHRRELTLGGWARGGSIAFMAALAVFSFVTLTGNRYLGQASGALDRSETATAARDARRAARWAPWSADALELQADAALADGDYADARRLYRRAIAKDGGDWELWLDLALASTGDARRHAIDQAVALNPLGRAIEQLRSG
jgi:O-antigen ligase